MSGDRPAAHRYLPRIVRGRRFRDRTAIARNYGAPQQSSAAAVAASPWIEQRIFRCPACQVALFSRYTRATIRYVRGGTLDDPGSVTPDVHIYTRSRVPWVELPESVPAFRTYYDPEKVWSAESLERLAALAQR